MELNAPWLCKAHANAKSPSPKFCAKSVPRAQLAAVGAVLAMSRFFRRATDVGRERAQRTVPTLTWSQGSSSIGAFVGADFCELQNRPSHSGYRRAAGADRVRQSFGINATQKAAPQNPQASAEVRRCFMGRVIIDPAQIAP
jgi:hypothetical protein